MLQIHNAKKWNCKYNIYGWHICSNIYMSSLTSEALFCWDIWYINSKSELFIYFPCLHWTHFSSELFLSFRKQYCMFVFLFILYKWAYMFVYMCVFIHTCIYKVMYIDLYGCLFQCFRIKSVFIFRVQSISAIFIYRPCWLTTRKCSR